MGETLATRMAKMLTDVPPVTYDQGDMAYRCYYCDAPSGPDRNLKDSHGETCEYAKLMVDVATGLSKVE